MTAPHSPAASRSEVARAYLSPRPTHWRCGAASSPGLQTAALPGSWQACCRVSGHPRAGARFPGPGHDVAARMKSAGETPTRSAHGFLAGLPPRVQHLRPAQRLPNCVGQADVSPHTSRCALSPCDSAPGRHVLLARTRVSHPLCVPRREVSHPGRANSRSCFQKLRASRGRCRCVHSVDHLQTPVGWRPCAGVRRWRPSLGVSGSVHCGEDRSIFWFHVKPGDPSLYLAMRLSSSGSGFAELESTGRCPTSRRAVACSAQWGTGTVGSNHLQTASALALCECSGLRCRRNPTRPWSRSSRLSRERHLNLCARDQASRGTSIPA